MPIHTGYISNVASDLKELRRLLDRLDGAFRTYKKMNLGAAEVQLVSGYMVEVLKGIQGAVDKDTAFLEQKAKRGP